MNWEAKKVPRKEIQGGGYIEARERETRDVLSSCGQGDRAGNVNGLFTRLREGMCFAVCEMGRITNGLWDSWGIT